MGCGESAMAKGEASKEEEKRGINLGDTLILLNFHTVCKRFFAIDFLQSHFTIAFITSGMDRHVL